MNSSKRRAQCAGLNDLERHNATFSRERSDARPVELRRVAAIGLTVGRHDLALFHRSGLLSTSFDDFQYFPEVGAAIAIARGSPCHVGGLRPRDLGRRGAAQLHRQQCQLRSLPAGIVA